MRVGTVKIALLHNIVAIFFAIIFLSTAQASEYRLLTGDIPPWSMSSSAEFPGPVIEIMKEVDRRLGNETELEVIPWGRAQEIAKREKNVIIFPLTRVPEREDSYSWIFPIRKMNFAFVTTDNRKLDAEQARSLSGILVHGNSLPQIILERMGFTNLILFATNYSGITKVLHKGRAESWFADVDMLRWMHTTNPGRNDLTIGPNIFDGVLYAAGSPGLSKETISRFHKALSELKQDGTMQQIFSRYGL